MKLCHNISVDQNVERKADSGAYLAFTAVIIVVLLAFLGLVFGASQGFTARSQAEHVARIAAMAGLNQFATSSLGTVPAKVIDARTRANYIISQNPINSTLGPLLPLDDSTFKAGTYYRAAPAGGEPRCSNYPCFFEYDSTSPSPVNSVKITPTTAALVDNGFVKLIGNGLAQTSATATASITPLCITYAVDSSGSSAYDYHRSGPGLSVNPHPSPHFNDPKATVAMYRGTEVDQFYGGQGSVDCSNPSTWQMGSYLWCQMIHTRPSCQPLNPKLPLLPVDNSRHYWSDYHLRSVPWNPASLHAADLWIDSFWYPTKEFIGAAPYSYYFQAVNTSVQWLSARGAPDDLVRFRGFNSRLQPPIPNDTMGFPIQERFTANWEIVKQVSDLRNIGLTGCDGSNLPAYPEHTPNAISLGYFPLLTGQSLFDETPVVQALDDAVNTARDYCPVASKRVVVLLSDGVTTCSRNTCGDADGDSIPNQIGDYDRAIRDMTDRSISNSTINTATENGITIITVLGGKHVRPNTRNISDGHGGFIDQEEAISGGLDFVNSSSNPANENAALSTLGDPNSYFGKPNRYFFDLAAQTGGRFCPIRPLCIDPGTCGLAGCYEPDPTNPTGPFRLKNAFRVAHPVQDCAEYRLSPGEQAASCVADALAKDPVGIVTNP